MKKKKRMVAIAVKNSTMKKVKMRMKMRMRNNNQIIGTPNRKSYQVDIACKESGWLKNNNSLSMLPINLLFFNYLKMGTRS
jgi:hypothetical protein